jgi:hypothetical protein
MTTTTTTVMENMAGKTLQEPINQLMPHTTSNRMSTRCTAQTSTTSTDMTNKDTTGAHGTRTILINTAMAKMVSVGALICWWCQAVTVGSSALYPSLACYHTALRQGLAHSLAGRLAGAAALSMAQPVAYAWLRQPCAVLLHLLASVKRNTSRACQPCVSLVPRQCCLRCLHLHTYMLYL